MVDKDHDGDIWLATAALALVIIALALMIANMSYFQLGDAQPPLGPESRQVAEVLSYVLLGVWICVGILVMVQMARKGKASGKVKKESRSGGTVTALIVVFVILGAVLVFIYMTGGSVVTPPTTPSGGGGGGGGSSPPLSADGPGGSLMLIGLLILVALLAIVLGLRYVRRTPVRMTSARAAMERQKAKDIVDQAVRDLYTGDDARSVVVRTYQMMSRLLRGKVMDAEVLTPRELATLAESRLGWPKEPTRELTSLFEEAWYSDHQLREESKETALRCLRQISSYVSGSQGAQRRGADAAGS